MIKHLIRNAQILRITMKKDDKFVGAFKARQEQTWDVITVACRKVRLYGAHLLP